MGPLEFIYYLGYSFKKSRDLRNLKRLPRRVISVGNLTLGGTGKTPAVIAIAEEAKKRGYLPCVLTRGYKGRAKGPCFVSKGEGPLLSADESGDEAFLMAGSLKGVPIVKGSDRYEAGMFALQNLGPSFPLESIHRLIFILDDGFQHLRLHRDMDILLIDGSNPFGNGRLFPSGILREPMEEMKRADVIVITRADVNAGDAGARTAGLKEMVRRYNRGAPIFLGEHRPTSLRTASGRVLPIGAIAGKTVFGFCGIGNPESFRHTLLGTGAKMAGLNVFRDHHRYRLQDVRRILNTAKGLNADWIVTTEKDIIRLKDFALEADIVSLGIKFMAEEGLFAEIFREE